MSPEERELRVLRMERRAMQEEVESAAAEQEAAQRTLDMALLQLGNRSTEITLEMPDREFRGVITHIGEDIATLHSSGASFQPVLDAVVAVRYSPGPGVAQAVSAGHPRTLVARLRELVVQEEQATLGRRQGHPVVGSITTVTPTHAELTDARGTQWIVPLNQVSWLGPVNS